MTLFCHCGCIKLKVKPFGRKIQDDPILTRSVDAYNDCVESHKMTLFLQDILPLWMTRKFKTTIVFASVDVSSEGHSVGS